MYTTLISCQALAANLQNPDWVVMDCRFVLNDPELGRQEYQTSHIPQALYAHLDEDLSGTIIPQKTGRHPLPDPEILAQTFSRWGIDAKTQVIGYDDALGAMAARLWWMLRWLGHDRVAVLNGGWQQWQAENQPVTSETQGREPRSFVPQLRRDLLVNAEQVLAVLGKADYCLLDARTADRFRGENETIDPIAGHIAHAHSAPFSENTEHGLFLSQEALQARFRSLLGEVPADKTICYCGSGVTACHNLLAIAHAGMGEGKLFAGSWSEWVTDPSRPMAK